MFVVYRTFRSAARAILAIVILAGVGLSAANAQQYQTPSVAEFLANPAQLLARNPIGGQLLANEVQQLALADPSTFRILLALLANANDLQKRSLGEGLAQATKIEVLTDQALAEGWQDQIAASDDPTFKTAATNAFGDVQLGAVGGGPLGGNGGGPSSSVSASSGPPANSRSTPVPTQPFTFTATTTAGPGLSFTTNTTPATPATPVSP
jgi:hypothetical protein